MRSRPPQPPDERERKRLQHDRDDDREAAESDRAQGRDLACAGPDAAYIVLSAANVAPRAMMSVTTPASMPIVWRNCLVCPL
jgi:hypothetical protein